MVKSRRTKRNMNYNKEKKVGTNLFEKIQHKYNDRFQHHDNIYELTNEA